jgi:nucleotide-binding universal stress UspA family protein
MINRILVPIDGSDPAVRALDFALDIAQKYSAEILILTVVQYPVLSEIPLNIQEYYREIKASYDQMLSQALEKAKKTTPNLHITSKLMEGHPVDKIIENAIEGKFDMIVMGRRGQGHLTHTLLGSVSDRVADQTPCALLIIK